MSIRICGKEYYRPGENLSIEGYNPDDIYNVMRDTYTVLFKCEKSGGDNYDYPEETYVEPLERSVNEVNHDIAKIHDPELRDAVQDEFNEWLGNVQPGNYYDSPDYEPYDNTLNEQNKRKFFKTHETMKLNEQAKRYIKRLVMEAINEMPGKKFVIQTRTGAYFMEIQDDATEYDENTLELSALVGRSVVLIRVDKSDYEALVNNGQSCEATYRVMEKSNNPSTENQCTLSVYNG